MTAAMDAVGARFQRNEIYVPEMLIAARAMKEATAAARAAARRRPASGRSATAVIGTVKGDLHDIGKNLVGMMWKGANIEVIDLGTNVPPERFVDAAAEHGAHIVGISALLTTTMVGMGDVVRASARPTWVQGHRRRRAGDGRFAPEIGADGYAPDAASAVEVAQAALAR